MGTIDEIEKRPLSKSLSNTEAASSNKKKKESSPENEKKDDVKITKFFKTSTPTKKNAKIQKPTHGYYLVDSKTRNTRSMPNLKYSVAVSHYFEKTESFNSS